LSCDGFGADLGDERPSAQTEGVRQSGSRLTAEISTGKLFQLRLSQTQHTNGSFPQLEKKIRCIKKRRDISGAEKKKTAACETREENHIFGRRLSFLAPFLASP